MTLFQFMALITINGIVSYFIYIATRTVIWDEFQTVYTTILKIVKSINERDGK